jgi:hypothetical protein
METALFKQFEKKFGKSWVCVCGGSFQSGWLESVSEGKEGATARYLCRLCGREQLFFISPKEKADDSDPAAEPRRNQLTSDDVLDIKQELAEVSLRQIKGLAKKKEASKVALSKISQHEGI